MAALMDLRLFKWSALVASVLLMFLAAGVMVFGTKLEIIPANAVAVLSILVWLGCVVSAISRWFRSKRSSEQFSRKADPRVKYETALPGGAWMFDAGTGRLVGQMVSELQSDRLISPRSDWTLYGVVLGEAGLAGPVQLVELDISSRVNQGPEPLVVRKLSSI